ncbi:HEAT repeat domain-containing protein [Nannocystis radixulma]|uniref:HEAT repeat domain-containing protein n=1 Tax=Nannocystis radixulma TaxID=2995305 RepID=A0ABT5BGZ9_9BACT|nr:HEAT repeat domain-containing protein [Nannocystis radixulma]MDC0673426.1 HEAT repeat domain-containing protein [Nannocystis radixulma]
MPHHHERDRGRRAVRPTTIACTGLLLAGAVWATQGARGIGEPAVGVKSEASARSLFSGVFAESAASTRHACSFAPGTRMAYDVVSDTRIEVDFGRLSDDVDAGGQVQLKATPAQARQTERSWHIDLVALAGEDDGASVLAARIEDRGTVITGDAAPGVAPPAALSDTFLIRVDARCAIREFGWRADGDLAAARDQQQLAAGLGFWAPSDPGRAASYAGTGFDSTGRYTAKYHHEDGRVTGEALSFVLADGVASGMTVGVEIVASTIEIALSEDAWFESLSDTRELEFSVGERAFGTQARTITARRAEAGSFAPRIDPGDAGWRWGVLSNMLHDSSQDFDAKLRDLPLADAMARYRELLAGGQLGDYGGLLRGWLRANPERTGELVALLRAGEFDGQQHARAGVFWALGAANTEQARTALVGVIREWPETRHQISAAQALAMVERPTPEMVEAMVESAGREGLHAVERGSMVLAVGTLAGTNATRSPEVAAAARAEIRGWLSGSRDEQQLGHALQAAGNAGHDELAADIRPFFAHESATIRRQATHALRNMSPEQAYPSLEKMLADDDRTVRTSALATAADISRRSERAPTAAMVELAAGSLDGALQAEEHAAVALLGEAARRGDARADELLRAHVKARVAGPEQDPQQLAVLARSTPGHWRAAP